MNEKPPPKRGAPKGNKNARKHGFYSRVFTEEEQREWKSAAGGQLQPEINLFRVLIARTAQRLMSADARSFSFMENLAMLQAVSMAVARLNSLCRTNEKLYSADNKSDLEFIDRLGLTEEESKSESYATGEKSLGAQPGNTNALKHGFYASVFKPEEIRKLETIKNNEVDDEIALIRVLIKRTVASMFEQTDLDLLDYLKAIRVITYAGSCVEKMECTKKLVNPHPTMMDYLFKQVALANEQQGVVR
jgi:hypothetical protein